MKCVPSGVSGPVDLWGAPDNTVVGGDLPDLFWAVGPAEVLAAGRTTNCCDEEGGVIL